MSKEDVRRWARFGLAAFFAIGGVAHFALLEFFVAIMPSYIPWHVPLVYISGVFELLGAAGILTTRWRRLSGVGLMALTVAVFPANLNMALNPASFDAFPPWVLLARLPVQLLILWWVWWTCVTTARCPD
jgi:uncharacterized membrane protein